MVSSSKSTAQQRASNDACIESVELGSFADFIDEFPLAGERLYLTVFERNSGFVKTQKTKFAVVNLEKILTSTFEVSAESGFDRMSLRDLSRQTGMSMGAIYSCISKKEDIAIMIADIVKLSNSFAHRHALDGNDAWHRIERVIRYHLYASTVLQSWYFFLYFETRSLPEPQQQESKQIELGSIDALEAAILAGVESGEFKTNDARMVANTIVVLLEDWYLKPWKTRVFEYKNDAIHKQEELINQYNRSLLELVKTLVAYS